MLYICDRADHVTWVASGGTVSREWKKWEFDSEEMVRDVTEEKRKWSYDEMMKASGCVVNFAGEITQMYWILDHGFIELYNGSAWSWTGSRVILYRWYLYSGYRVSLTWSF